MAFAEMTSEEAVRWRQAGLLVALMSRMQQEMFNRIVDGDVPPEWDGIELRQWLADRAGECSITWKQQTAKRRRDYRNAILTGNL